MKMKTAAAVAVLGILGAGSAMADHKEAGMSYDNHHDDGVLYPNQEFSVDIFGTYGLRQETFENNLNTTTVRHGRLGVGAGLNYFFTRNIGVGADAWLNDDRGVADFVNGSVIGRFPIGTTGFAPYIFGGGGYQFEQVDQWVAHAGVGLEFRFARHVGVFTDGRFIFCDKTDNFGLFRLGMRFGF